MSAQKEGITREELARRIEAASKDVPKIDKLAWRTIYLSLSRERKRIGKLLYDAEALLPEDAPEVRTWLARLNDQLAHIRRIMDLIGEEGRKMLIRGVGRDIFLVDDDGPHEEQDQAEPQMKVE